MWCTARTRRGQPCRNKAMKGTDVCGPHADQDARSGASPRARAARKAKRPTRPDNDKSSAKRQPGGGRYNLSEAQASEVGQTINPRKLRSEGFEAKYTTECVSCGETIWRGRSIVRSTSKKRPGFKHANCKQRHL